VIYHLELAFNCGRKGLELCWTKGAEILVTVVTCVLLQILIFVAETLLSLNWALVTDILMVNTNFTVSVMSVQRPMV